MLKTVSSIANALGALNYKGTWNASTNVPTLASGVGTQGDYYVVSVAGSTDLDGVTNWGVGDWAAFNGSVWQRLEGGADGNFVNLTVSNTATVDGLATFNGNAQFPDNSKAIFGAGSDLEIYHDGSNSYIKDTGTGDLRVYAQDFQIRNADGSNTMLYANAPTGGIQLFHTGAEKLATTATGIDVTGSVTADGVDSQLSGSGGLPVTSGTAQTYGSLRVGATSFNTILDMGSAGASGAWLQASDKTALGTNYPLLLNPNGGNVGIGTSSPQASLTVAGGLPAASSPATYAGTIQINETALTTLQEVGGLEFRGAVFGAGYGSKITSTDTGSLLFGRRSNNVSWSESMRLDAGGSLLLGKTAADSIGTDGIELDGTNDRVLITRNDNEPLVLNRRTSDGDIVVFRKDSTVGSIGVASGDRLYISTADGLGLQLDKDNNRIVPVAADGSTYNSNVSLGSSGLEFKDLYLSGGVVFGDAGGTGSSSSNTFDSYEEGTFTPVVADATSGGNTGTASTADGFYTKIGNMVYLSVTLLNVNTSGMTAGNAFYIRSLPFTSSTGNAGRAEGSIRSDSVTFAGSITANMDINDSWVRLADSASGVGDVSLTVAAINSGVTDLFFSIAYQSA
jgi:hypothetical protein